jgi:hypothetical protein
MLDNTHVLEAVWSQNLNMAYIIFSAVYICSSLFLLCFHFQAQGIHVVSLLRMMFNELLNVSNRCFSEFFIWFDKVCTKYGLFVSITCRKPNVFLRY